MATLSLTGFYASLLGILYIGLAFNIIRLRRKFKVGIGSGDNKFLAKAIRIHGNFIGGLRVKWRFGDGVTCLGCYFGCWPCVTCDWFNKKYWNFNSTTSWYDVDIFSYFDFSYRKYSQFYCCLKTKNFTMTSLCLGDKML